MANRYVCPAEGGNLVSRAEKQLEREQKETGSEGAALGRRLRKHGLNRSVEHQRRCGHSGGGGSGLTAGGGNCDFIQGVMV